VKNSFAIDDISELYLYTHVIPAKAGIQSAALLDTRLRGYDVYGIYLILALLSFLLSLSPRRREAGIQLNGKIRLLRNHQEIRHRTYETKY